APAVMPGCEPSHTVGTCSYGNGKAEGREQVPECELAVLHLRGARHNGGREEHGKSSPLLVGAFTLCHEGLPSCLVFAGPFEKVTAPPESDRIAEESARFPGDRRDEETRREVEGALTRRNACRPGGGCADERHAS